MKQKIHRLLMVEHRTILETCYQQVFFKDSQTPPIKTFEDCLSDFYIYLLEAKPKKVPGKTEGYYLTQVRDEKALPEWLRRTFRRFLLEEHKILCEMQEALAEYRLQLASQRGEQPLDITLMHVAFSLAWFNQHESEEDRYLFFRSAYRHFSGFFSWPDGELDDNDVAYVLGISQGSLRTRTSRLCAKVRRLVGELNDALIASLDSASLDLAHSIYAVQEPDIESILENLLDKAERDLPQYEEIVSLRKKKRRSVHTFSVARRRPIGLEFEMACYMAPMEPSYSPECIDFMECEPRESGSSRIINMFKQFIGM